MASVETTDAPVFLGLQLHEDLLRAEFEAIIAAEYPAPRSPHPSAQAGSGRRSRPLLRVRTPRGRSAFGATATGEPECPGRSRSPPDTRPRPVAADKDRR
jgi:hypothetical protein